MVNTRRYKKKGAKKVEPPKKRKIGTPLNPADLFHADIIAVLGPEAEGMTVERALPLYRERLGYATGAYAPARSTGAAMETPKLSFKNPKIVRAEIMRSLEKLGVKPSRNLISELFEKVQSSEAKRGRSFIFKDDVYDLVKHSIIEKWKEKR